MVAFVLMAQAALAPIRAQAEERPIRLWLGASPVARGEIVPVYVAAATEGYLLVLRTTTDGHVEVVFPSDPKSNGAIRPGAYALRAANGRPAFVADERNGTGLVLAALSPRPFRSTEFLRAGAWSRDALIASWPGADGPGTLTDIVQRMLGDGWFTYDMAIYTVGARAPHPLSPSQVTGEGGPGIGVCNGCTVVYQSPTPVVYQTIVQETVVQQPVAEPIVIFPTLCDPFIGACHRRVREPERPRFKTEGVCHVGIDCPPGTGTPAKAIRLSLSTIARPAPPVSEPPVSVPPPVTVMVVGHPSVPMGHPSVPMGQPSVAMNPGLAPGVSTATTLSVPMVTRTGSRFSMSPRQPSATPQTRTIALPRAAFRRH